MWRVFPLLICLSGCGGLAWNTTVADHVSVRQAMIDSVIPGVTTETHLVSRWGNPTQKSREGAETRFIYRSMTNPEGYRMPQFGDSSRYVIVTFQYGLATGATSSDIEGCRATFAPRPPGSGFDNPTTVHPVNCRGVANPVTDVDSPISPPAEITQTAGSPSTEPEGKL